MTRHPLDAEPVASYPPPMRILFIPLFLVTLATPATAWQATTGETCTLTHETTDTRVHLTYDPSKPLYTLAITRKSAPWQTAPWFAMRFLGPNEITISTPKHALSDNDQTLNVADSGFGNVLDGLQFNHTAVAFTQAQTVPISLKGAGPEVQKFRDCAAAQLS
ncbi:hypothetical protein [Shimia sp. R9_3]|uniref:hypothetical protein n=1 Tax=Shimia sp. R9_3 TaxID=2821113 RepID=UPI001ADA2800|nr:hypothetical protein [Shimia sp. R9_3]